MQGPEIKRHPRRDAEIHEVSKAVELSTEARSAFEEPCHPPVDAVEHRRKYDCINRPFERAFCGKANRRQPCAERKQGDDVRYHGAHRNGAEAAGPSRRSMLKRGAQGISHIHNIAGWAPISQLHSRLRRLGPLRQVPLPFTHIPMQQYRRLLYKSSSRGYRWFLCRRADIVALTSAISRDRSSHAVGHDPAKQVAATSDRRLHAA